RSGVHPVLELVRLRAAEDGSKTEAQRRKPRHHAVLVPRGDPGWTGPVPVLRAAAVGTARDDGRRRPRPSGGSVRTPGRRSCRGASADAAHPAPGCSGAGSVTDPPRAARWLPAGILLADGGMGTS